VLRCRSPSPKRTCLRSLYSLEKKKQVGRSNAQNGALQRSPIMNSNAQDQSSTTADSDDSATMMQLRSRNPFVTRKEESVTVHQKSLFVSRNGLQLPKRPTVITHGSGTASSSSSKKNSMVTDPGRSSPGRPPVETFQREEAIVVVEKLEFREVSTRKCKSRYVNESHSNASFVIQYQKLFIFCSLCLCLLLFK